MKKKKFMLVALFTMFLAGGLFAQPGWGTGDNQNPDTAAPLGGLVVLLASGAAYGVKKVKEYK